MKTKLLPWEGFPREWIIPLVVPLTWGTRDKPVPQTLPRKVFFAYRMAFSWAGGTAFAVWFQLDYVSFDRQQGRFLSPARYFSLRGKDLVEVCQDL